MAEVINFTGITRLDLPPDRILEGAKGKLKGVLVLGYDENDEFYAASSYADGGVVLWLMEHCKYELMKGGGIIE